MVPSLRINNYSKCCISLYQTINSENVKYYKVLLKSVNQVTKKGVERSYLIPESALNQDVRKKLGVTAEPHFARTFRAQNEAIVAQKQFIPNLALGEHLKSTLLARLNYKTLTPCQSQNIIMAATSTNKPQSVVEDEQRHDASRNRPGSFLNHRRLPQHRHFPGGDNRRNNLWRRTVTQNRSSNVGVRGNLCRLSQEETLRGSPTQNKLQGGNNSRAEVVQNQPQTHLTPTNPPPYQNLIALLRRDSEYEARASSVVNLKETLTSFLTQNEEEEVKEEEEEGKEEEEKEKEEEEVERGNSPQTYSDQPIIKEISLSSTFFQTNPSPQGVALGPLTFGADPNQPQLMSLEAYKCGICAQNFDTRVELTGHMHAHKKRAHTCEACGKTFPSSSRLNNHQVIHTKDKKFPCDVCGKVYKTKNSLKIHVCTNTIMERNFTCEICGKKFYRLQLLKNHVNTQHTNAKHKCDVCQKEYRQYFSLKMHKKLHDPHFVALSLKCDQCEARFTFKTALRKHKLRVHVGEVFMCDVCGKELASSVSFQSHLRTHTGEKPYACEICDKAFASKSILRTHIRIHTKEKPYPCKVCGKRFSQVGSVNIHVLRVHRREKQFQCNICSEKFGTKVQLKAHTRLHGIPLSELGSETKLARRS